MCIMLSVTLSCISKPNRQCPFVCDSSCINGHRRHRDRQYTRSDSAAHWLSIMAQERNINAANETIIAVGTASTQALLVSLGVPVVANLESSTVYDVYRQFRGKFTDRMVTFQPPSEAVFLSAYSVFARIPTTEYMGSDGGPTAQMIMRDLQQISGVNVAMGWGPEEQYVTELGRYNTLVHASDFNLDLPVLTNLHVHAHVKPEDASSKAKAAKADLTMHRADKAGLSKHTVAFVMTDGDNLQWLLGGWSTDPRWYGHPQRGIVPMGWTFSPATQYIAPVPAAHMRGQATRNDSFVGAASGLGYIYPSSYSDIRTFANVTGQSFRDGDFNILNVLDQRYDEYAVEQLMSHDELDAMLIYLGQCYAGTNGMSTFVNGKPVLSARVALWSGVSHSSHCQGVDGVVARLLMQERDPTRLEGYSIVPVHAWSHNYSDVIRVVQALELAGGVDVVTPDQLIQRIKANVSPVPSCPIPTGSYADSCSKCNIDVSCTLGCECSFQGLFYDTFYDLHHCCILDNINGTLACASP
eukprot:TRINITY_DN11432_c0_g2_i4.p1 TRINITY_DN11432_c0_g2~~TRINITY_DN11432_c0_g2_i4.p1  ORF type:complete len:526 (+),score=83.70 TRINITY_DN11432_c0_g2_i4:43-1620(+)